MNHEDSFHGVRLFHFVTAYAPDESDVASPLRNSYKLAIFRSSRRNTRGGPSARWSGSRVSRTGTGDSFFAGRPGTRQRAGGGAARRARTASAAIAVGPRLGRIGVGGHFAGDRGLLRVPLRPRRRRRRDARRADLPLWIWGVWTAWSPVPPTLTVLMRRTLRTRHRPHSH